MAIHVCLNTYGFNNLAKIKAELQRVRPRLASLNNGSVVEVSYADRKQSMFNRDNTTGSDETLKSLGVGLIYRKDGETSANDDDIIIEHGLKGNIETINDLKPAADDGGLLHILLPMHSHGIPFQELETLASQIGMPVDVLATGLSSALGVSATGNLGAIMKLAKECRKAGQRDPNNRRKVSVLNGGHGTRLEQMRKLKGALQFGRNNLTIWNLLTGIFFRSQMPQIEDENDEFYVHLANDGILIPFGVLTSQARVLSEIPQEEAKDAYFFASPDDPSTMSQAETERFGMIALLSDGTFICATEKEGRAATLETAQQKLADLGIDVETEEVRLYINYYGMSTRPRFEEAMDDFLQTIVRPNLTTDEVGDLDTYSLVFAAMSSASPADFRANCKKMGLNRLLIEKMIDDEFFPKLQKALFETDADGNVIYSRPGLPKLRVGFAEFNRGAVTLDIGTLPSLNALFSSMVGNYDQDSEARLDFIKTVRTLINRGVIRQSGGELENELLSLERIIQNNDRVQRNLMLSLAGFDPNLPLENVEIESGANPPIIGIPTREWIPQELINKIENADIRRQIYSIILSQHRDELRERRLVDGRLITCNVGERTDGQLLYFLHHEHINTVKIASSYDPTNPQKIGPDHICRIKPWSIIGRDTLIIDSEIGDGVNPVIIGDRSRVIASRQAQSIYHPDAENFDLETVRPQLLEASAEGQKEVEVSLPGGWLAKCTYKGTIADQETGVAFGDQLASIASAQGQRLPASLATVPEAGERNHDLSVNLDEMIITREFDVEEDTPGLANLSFRLGSQTGRINSRTRTHRWEVELTKDSPAHAVVYGRNQTDVPIMVTENGFHYVKDPVGPAPAQDVMVPENVDPKKDPIRGTFPGPGETQGMPSKHRLMQLTYGKYYIRDAKLTNAQLLELNDHRSVPIEEEMARYVEKLLQQLPFGDQHPQTVTHNPDIVDKPALAANIRTALANNENLERAIDLALREQTPEIIGRLITNGFGPDAANYDNQVPLVANAINALLDEGHNNPIGALYEELHITGDSPAHRHARRIVRDVIKGFPHSQMIFRRQDHGLTIKTFRLGALHSLVESFRTVERPVIEPLNRENQLVSHSLAAEYQPIMATETLAS